MIFDLLKRARCAPGSARSGTGPCPPRHGGGDEPPDEPACCSDADFADSNPTVCLNDDSRCSDPTFGQENPLLCPNSSRLLLKPGRLFKGPAQQVRFQAYLLANGQESLLSAGVTYQSDNLAVGVVGASSGSFSTVAPGICTVSAEWGGLIAYAQVECVADCASRVTDFVILIDNSLSMGVSFSNLSPSKLAFAKDKARDFVDTIDLSKDKVAVYAFNIGANLLLTFSQDATAIKNAIQSIAPTDFSTGLKGSLTPATSALDALGTGQTHCIVLFSDGENKLGGNPLPDAAAFRAQGNILAVVGCRAYGGGFKLLEGMATPGFFLNAYQATQASIPTWLAGIKGYFCAGNCDPPPDLCVPYAALNYSAFQFWNVSGVVDLIGEGVDSNGDPSGQPLYDFLPGNGLYVDSRGSSNPWDGTITTKDTFEFADTRSYRLSLKVAGNQRENLTPWTLLVKVIATNEDNEQNVLLDEVITITNWKQDFTQYSFDFEGAATNNLGRISIAHGSSPSGATPYVGLLFDNILLESGDTGDVDSDTTTMFADNFDTENLTCLGQGVTPLGPNLVPSDAVYEEQLYSVPGIIAGGSYFWKPGANADQMRNNEDTYLVADYPNGVFFTAATTEVLLSALSIEPNVPVLDTVATATSGCPPEDCSVPSTCEGTQPATFGIAGYHDGFFDLSACEALLSEGETFCLGNAAWDGQFTQVSNCTWNGAGDAFGDPRSLGGGKLIYGIQLTFPPAVGKWVMAVELQSCFEGAYSSRYTLWQGEHCGSGPLGVWTKTSGCAVGRDTITIGDIGQSTCGEPNPASGCLDDEPIPAQIPDPNPTTDIEGCGVEGGGTGNNGGGNPSNLLEII